MMDVRIPPPVRQKPATDMIIPIRGNKLATSPLLVEWVIELLFLMYQLLL